MAASCDIIDDYLITNDAEYEDKQKATLLAASCDITDDYLVANDAKYEAKQKATRLAASCDIGYGTRGAVLDQGENFFVHKYRYGLLRFEVQRSSTRLPDIQ